MPSAVAVNWTNDADDYLYNAKRALVDYLTTDNASALLSGLYTSLNGLGLASTSFTHAPYDEPHNIHGGSNYPVVNIEALVLGKRFVETNGLGLVALMRLGVFMVGSDPVQAVRKCESISAGISAMVSLTVKGEAFADTSAALWATHYSNFVGPDLNDPASSGAELLQNQEGRPTGVAGNVIEFQFMRLEDIS